MNAFARRADDRSPWLAVFGTLLTLFGLMRMAITDVQYGLFLALGGMLVAWEPLGKRTQGAALDAGSHHGELRWPPCCY